MDGQQEVQVSVSKMTAEYMERYRILFECSSADFSAMIKDVTSNLKSGDVVGLDACLKKLRDAASIECDPILTIDRNFQPDEIFTQVLRNLNDDTILERILVVLGALTFPNKLQTFVLSVEFLKVLTKAISETSIYELKIMGAVILANLSTWECNSKLMASRESCTLSFLVDILGKCKDTSTRNSILLAISNVARVEDNLIAMADPELGLIDVLIPEINYGVGFGGNKALVTIAYLSVPPTNRSILASLDRGLVATLLQIISGSEISEQARIVSLGVLLNLLAYQENLIPLACSGLTLIETLVRLVRQDEGKVQLLALGALMNLSHAAANRQYMASPGLGLMQALVSVLTVGEITGSVDLKSRALGTLVNLSLEPSNRHYMSSPSIGLVLSLTTCALAMNNVIRTQCLGILKNLSCAPENHAFMAAPALHVVEVLSFALANFQLPKFTANNVRVQCRRRGKRAKRSDCAVTELQSQYSVPLETEERKQQLSALMTFANLSVDKSIASQILQPDLQILQKIVYILEARVQGDFLISTLGTVMNLSNSWTLTTHSHELLQVLLDLAASKQTPDYPKVLALGGIANILAAPAEDLHIAQLKGGVPNLVRILMNILRGPVAGRNCIAALGSLMNLSNYELNHCFLLDSNVGLLFGLAGMIRDNKAEEYVFYALQILANLAKTSTRTMSLSTAFTVVVDTLVGVVHRSSYGWAQEGAMGVLIHLATIPSVRSQLSCLAMGPLLMRILDDFDVVGSRATKQRAQELLMILTSPQRHDEENDRDNADNFDDVDRRHGARALFHSPGTVTSAATDPPGDESESSANSSGEKAAGAHALLALLTQEPTGDKGMDNMYETAAFFQSPGLSCEPTEPTYSAPAAAHGDESESSANSSGEKTVVVISADSVVASLGGDCDRTPSMMLRTPLEEDGENPSSLVGLWAQHMAQLAVGVDHQRLDKEKTTPAATEAGEEPESPLQKRAKL